MYSICIVLTSIFLSYIRFYLIYVDIMYSYYIYRIHLTQELRHEVKMNNGRTQIEQLDEKLYMIGTISKLTGASAITLHAWKRRHRLIQPVHKDRGHRLYTRSHIDQINRITALT